MKRTKVLANVLIVIMIVMLLVMLPEFLATVDLHHNYVSKIVVSRYAPESLNALPYWSDAPGLWKMLNVSFTSRIILIISSLILLIGISFRIKKENPAV